MLWEEGQFPVWRSTIMGGVPFAANPLTGLYYPLNWPLLFLPWLPLEVGFNLSALVHLYLAGAAMYALMRRGVGTGVWGSLLAAVAYEASPKLLAHLGVGHIGWVQAWAWLPLVVLCMLKVSQSPSRQAARWGVGAGAGLAMQFCADVRMTAYTLMAVGMFMVARALGQLDSGRKRAVSGLRLEIRHLRVVIGALVVSVGLSACQWLPAVALLQDTTRSSMTLSDAVVWSLPWRYLAGLLLADHGGFHEWMTYIGVGTLVFAYRGVRSLWRKQDRQTGAGGTPVPRWFTGWLVALTVFATWFSLGENGRLFQILWRVLPGLGLLRVPPRAWVLVVFATAVLAGLGVEEARRLAGEERGRGKRSKRLLMLAMGSLPPMLLIGYWAIFSEPSLNLTMFGLVTPLAIGLFSAQRARCGTQWLGVAAVLLLALDLWVVDCTLIEARSPEDVFAAGRAAAEWLAEQPGSFRVYSPSYSVPQHVAERHNLELAYGVDPLQLRAYADYLNRAAGLQSPPGYSVTLPTIPEGGDVRTALENVCPEADMLGRLGVRYAAAAFPLNCPQQAAGRGWQLVGQFDDTYLYRIEDGHPIPDTESDMSIALADGSDLFRYNPRPVYVGWSVSGLTLAGVLAWAIGRCRSREVDG
jgi:hypothetical protein